MKPSEALRQAVHAIRQAPEDAFGAVTPKHDGDTGYYLRDELAYRVSLSIAEAELLEKLETAVRNYRALIEPARIVEGILAKLDALRGGDNGTS